MTEVEKVKELQEVVDMIFDANFAMVNCIEKLESKVQAALIAGLAHNNVIKGLVDANKTLTTRIEKLEALLN